MNLKKKMKGFFTLTRKANGGFTLVELIVVIAILAILAGIGVPAYSGYIRKANKAADQSTISDVKQALELYYYSHPSEVTTLGVILNQEGTPVAFAGTDEQKAQAQEALAAVFGSVENIGLKYADWEGETSALSYKDSNFYGKESELIDTVDMLTSALGKVVVEDESMADILFDSTFGDFLDDNGVNKSSNKAVGNAAVLYVAEHTKDKSDAIQSAFSTVLGPNGNVNNNTVNNLYTELMARGMGEVAATAAIYAYAEGYAQYSGQADAFHGMSFDGVTDGVSAANRLGQTLATLDLTKFSEYVSQGKGTADLTAYVDMMSTVYTNKDLVSGNLNAEDCFTDGTVENLLKGHAAMSELGIETEDGQVAVVLAVDGSTILTHVSPMTWNK